MAVATPLLVGRWARGQGLLQRELADKTARRARDRARDARHAAEEERARIAADLQVAVAEGLGTIVGHAAPLRGELRAGEHRAARERLADIAGTARAALGDVRRVLGVLRHDGEAPRLAPPRTDSRSAGAALRGPPPRRASRRAARVRRRAARAGREALADRLLAGGRVRRRRDRARDLGARGRAPLTAVAIAAPLLWRRRRPLAVAAAVLVAIGLQSSLLDLDSFPLGDILAMVVRDLRDRRVRRAAPGAGGAGADRRGRRGPRRGLLSGRRACPRCWAAWPCRGPSGASCAATATSRARGGERSLEIERSRAREARAAVTSERMRVARELHDAVAHNISVIAIQAGGADGIVERDPARAEQCVELIETVAREALAELGRLTRPAGRRGRRRRAEPGAGRPARRPGAGRRRPGRAVRRGPARDAARGRRSRRVPDRPGGPGQRRQARPRRPRLGDRALRPARDRARDRRRRARLERQADRPATAAATG